MDKTEISYAQVQLIGRKTADEMFQQVVCVKYKCEESLYLFDVMNSVHDKIITKQRPWNVL